jgi:hypothetical protein
MLETNNNQVMMTNTTYDVSKKLVQIWLPAVSALYFGLGQIWEWPYLDKVPGSIAVVTVFLGVVLNVSHNRYEASGARFDGEVIFTENEKGAVHPVLQADATLEELVEKGEVSFKVQEPPQHLYTPEVDLDDAPEVTPAPQRTAPKPPRKKAGAKKNT